MSVSTLLGSLSELGGVSGSGCGQSAEVSRAKQ